MKFLDKLFNYYLIFHQLWKFSFIPSITQFLCLKISFYDSVDIILLFPVFNQKTIIHHEEGDYTFKNTSSDKYNLIQLQWNQTFLNVCYGIVIKFLFKQKHSFKVIPIHHTFFLRCNVSILQLILFNCLLTIKYFTFNNLLQQCYIS